MVSASREPAVLQYGARIFVQYCLGCHSLSFVHYRDLQSMGISAQNVQSVFVPYHGHRADAMLSALSDRDAQQWFSGVVPPDLSLESRFRGVRWLYEFLTAFYRDSEQPMGWNNAVLPSVRMPNVFYAEQGSRERTCVQDHRMPASEQWVRESMLMDSAGNRYSSLVKLDHAVYPEVTCHFGKSVGGSMNDQQYHHMVYALVSFLAYVAEPYVALREKVGFCILPFLLLLSFLLYCLVRRCR